MARKHQPGWWIYKEQMDFLCYGDALWEPAPTNYSRINIGDVGFIRGGQFHLLFSAGCPLGERQLGKDVPSTFEELSVRTPVFGQPRMPACLRTDTVREVGAGLGATVSTALPLEPGVHFSFELTGTRGAALVTKYPTYREDPLLAAAFEEYTKRHYDSWVTFARHKKYGNNVRPVLVHGLDMTRDFAMVACSNEGTSLESDLTITVSVLASPSTSQCSPPGRAIDSPPSQPVDARSAPDEFNQCVFIRYYTMRSRKWMFPKAIRPGAGPHDLGSGESGGGALPELTVESNDKPATSGDEGLGGQWDINIDDTDSKPDIVVRNTPYDEEYHGWGAVGDHVFQNPDAASALMYRGDLMRIHRSGDAENVSKLLAKHRPQIVVDANGVERTIHQEIKPPRLPAPILPLFQRATSNSDGNVLRDLTEGIGSLALRQDTILSSQVPAPPPPLSHLPTFKFDDAVLKFLVEHVSSLPRLTDITPPSLQNGKWVPQKKYQKGPGRDLATNQNLVVFVRQDGSYIPVTAAVLGDYEGLVNRDLPVLDPAGFTITVRFEWPGYPPHDFQEAELQNFSCERTIGAPLLKGATEMVEIVQRFVEKIQGQEIAQEHAMWRVGINGIQAKCLRLAVLEQVSVGSWQPQLFYKPEF